MNLASFLAASAATRAERPAIADVGSGRSLTYAQVAREAGRVAAFLEAQGLEQGQRVALLAPNGVEYLPATFGLLSAGACVVPLAANLTPPEIARVLADIDVNAS